LPLTGADVRARNVFAGSNVFLADELGREPSRDFFDLLRSVFAWIESNAAFRAAKRHIENGALVRHHSGHRSDLISVYHFAVANPALHRLAMLALFSAPALEDFVVVSAKPYGKLKVVNVVACLDLT